MATLLSDAIILWVGSHPAQLLFHAARERMTAQNPPTIYTVLCPTLGSYAMSFPNKYYWAYKQGFRITPFHLFHHTPLTYFLHLLFHPLALFFWVDDRLPPKWLLIDYLKSKWVARGKSHLASQQQHILKLKEILHQPRPVPLGRYPKVQIAKHFITHLGPCFWWFGSKSPHSYSHNYQSDPGSDCAMLANT